MERFHSEFEKYLEIEYTIFYRNGNYVYGKNTVPSQHLIGICIDFICNNMQCLINFTESGDILFYCAKFGKQERHKDLFQFVLSVINTAYSIGEKRTQRQQPFQQKQMKLWN